MIRDENRWAPFNAVINGNYVVKVLEKEKSKVKKPILSSDQLEEIETKILTSFFSNTNILVKYYSNYQIQEIKGTITKLDATKKTISLNNTNILFSNIVEIENI